MSQKKRRLSPGTCLLLALAVGLLLFSTIGGALAALKYESKVLDSRLKYPTVRLAITDADGKTIDGDGVVRHLLGGESFIPGKAYDGNTVYVTNTGSAKEYVRVSVYRYWLDEKGGYTTLDPKLIRLDVADGWTPDGGTDGECVVYYRSAPLSGSAPFLKGVMVDGSVQTLGSQSPLSESEPNTIVTTYLYDGKTFNIELIADGVQTHNASDAIMSAWGVKSSAVGIG